MENQLPNWILPSNTRWLNFYELESIHLANSKIRQIFQSLLTETESNNISTLRVLWARIGWFDKATAWINSQLEYLSLNATDFIQQVKNWGISCLLKVRQRLEIYILKHHP